MGRASALRSQSGSMVSPSYVLATSLASKVAPLSTPSTSLRHASCEAAGNSAASGRSSAGAVMLTDCHGANGGPTPCAAKFWRSQVLAQERQRSVSGLGRRRLRRQLLHARSVHARQRL